MRTPIWRLTRSEPAQRLYERLAEHGVRISKVDQYGVDVERAASYEPPDGVDLACHRAGDLDRAEADAFVEPAQIDRVVTARRRGDLVGYVFLSSNRPVYVEALEAERLFDGAYVWRLFVEPSFRRAGIGRALVARAVAAAGEQGTDRANALMAVDNVPTKRVFSAVGFEPEKRSTFYRIYGYERRATREL